MRTPDSPRKEEDEFLCLWHGIMAGSPGPSWSGCWDGKNPSSHPCHVMVDAEELPAPLSLVDLGEDLIMLLVANITESNRPARTILRALAALSRSCSLVNRVMQPRFEDLRGLPAEVWKYTSGIVPAQLTWRIERQLLEEERVYSPSFRRGPHTWRLLLFPNGDDVERHRPGAPPHMSAFLDVADAAVLHHGWMRGAHFVTTLVNEALPSKSIVRYARHDFHQTARDWGFRELAPLSELEDVSGGFVGPDGELTLTVKVWGVTNEMHLAERQQRQQQRSSARGGGASSAFASSSASSTSLGSEDVGLRRSILSARRTLSALRHRLQSALSAPYLRRNSRGRNLAYRDVRDWDPAPTQADAAQHGFAHRL